MSRREESNPDDVREEVRAVERFWQVRLPEAFRNLHAHFTHPFLAPCEFFALSAIAEGVGRSFGMIPQFLPFGRAMGVPFGRAVDEVGIYGFYVTPETVWGRWPVLYWDEDEMYLRPVASDFEAFLRSCILIGRYEMEDQPEDTSDWDAQAEWRELMRRIGLSPELLQGSVPRSDSELYERLASSDPQDAVSLCHLGCVWRARGDGERALDFFHRAGEAAPWFGDPSYLVADIYRERGDYQRALQAWWAVVQCLLPLCTRTWEWDMGAEHPEADIYEVAADGLAQFCDLADAALKAQPLWRVVAQEDPYDPDVRESLADALLAHNDLAGAEGEYLNALSLCCSERGKQPERLYTALLTLYERAGRARDAALVRYDRALPRSTL
jgi:hypothetical protein